MVTKVVMDTKLVAADPLATLADELKAMGGMEPLVFAARFKGQGRVSQAYRDLFAARIKQRRLLQRGHGGDRFAALEANAVASLNTIRRFCPATG